jgi:hypothetical protein
VLRNTHGLCAWPLRLLAASRISLGGWEDRTIDARDRRRETIRCGSGRDRVAADRNDRLIGCERVTRR